MPEYAEHCALLISPTLEDHEIFEKVFHRQGWMLEHASSIHAASMLLNGKTAPVVITERDLPAANWKDVLDAIRGLEEPPLVIVISLLADEHLWAEALSMGVYDVLAKPLDQTEVVRVLSLAWSHRQERPAA
jgi:DNA-binding NtrC family response regulator